MLKSYHCNLRANEKVKRSHQKQLIQKTELNVVLRLRKSSNIRIHKVNIIRPSHSNFDNHDNSARQWRETAKKEYECLIK